MHLQCHRRAVCAEEHAFPVKLAIRAVALQDLRRACGHQTRQHLDHAAGTELQGKDDINTIC